MSEKQTYCPNCLTKYKVSVEQLTIARGMVCCAKCSTNFNALTHLVVEKNQNFSTTKDSLSVNSIQKNMPTMATTGSVLIDLSTPEQHLLDIFNRKVENSNIDLKTYLNNLNYFSTEPIRNYPIMNWDETSENNKKHSTRYYVIWLCVNLSLIGLLVFQFFWFNPKVFNNSPALGVLLNQVCQPINCSIMDDNYQLLATKKVKLESIADHRIQLTGELVNYHTKSLSLPILKINLKKKGKVVSSYSLNASEYLTTSLHGIQRIPQNSPFKFKFKLPVARESFDNYNLEIIPP